MERGGCLGENRSRNSFGQNTKKGKKNNERQADFQNEVKGCTTPLRTTVNCPEAQGENQGGPRGLQKTCFNKEKTVASVWAMLPRRGGQATKKVVPTGDQVKNGGRVAVGTYKLKLNDNTAGCT